MVEKSIFFETLFVFLIATIFWEAFNILHISFNANKPCSLRFYISDITGKTIISKEYHSIKGNQALQINTKQLKKGIYTVKLVNDYAGSRYLKFVK